MVGRAERAKRSWGAPDYTYPEHLRAELETLPATPGVYLFHGQSSTLPLYIGKSIHLRNRVMDHFRNAAEASLLRQTRSIQVIEMAGDIGAQLLESQLIKTLRPLYNQKLRRIPASFRSGCIAARCRSNIPARSIRRQRPGCTGCIPARVRPRKRCAAWPTSIVFATACWDWSGCKQAGPVSAPC